MDVRIFEFLLQFNQGLRHPLESLDVVEKLGSASPGYVNEIRTNLSELRVSSNGHFARKVAQRKREEENHSYRIRRKREKAEEDPNDIYWDGKVQEWPRRERGLLLRAVVLPWTPDDDDQIFAMQQGAGSYQPEQTAAIAKEVWEGAAQHEANNI